MGSPALAAYSLQITHLNKYWIHRAFLDVNYPNSKHIPNALVALHHIPVRIEYSPPFLHSLIVLPNNDEFWSRLASANKSRRWAIPLIVTYILVIFSVLLTVIDSIISHPADTWFGITSTWSFLLPLIIGWLRTGCEPEPSHLRNTLAAANQTAWVATEERGHPTMMRSPMAIQFAEADDVDLARKDELKPVPVFNYSRAFVTPMNAEVVLKLIKNAAANAQQRIPVRGSASGHFLGQVWVEGRSGEILAQNRVGTAAEIDEYCTREIQGHRWEPGQRPETGDFYPPLELHLVTPSSLWAPGIWRRVMIASVLALGLQWGTAGAAMFIHYTSPPVGLGCRSLSSLLYGAMGTVSFSLFLASSVFAHLSRPLPGRAHTQLRSRTCWVVGAVICRCLGKCVAIASAIGVLLICFFDVAGVFNSGFCKSATFDMGRRSIIFTGIPLMPDHRPVATWIGGLVMAFVTSTLFGFSMYVGLPPHRYE